MSDPIRDSKKFNREWQLRSILGVGNSNYSLENKIQLKIGKSNYRSEKGACRLAERSKASCIFH